MNVKRIPWAIAGSIAALSLALTACGGSGGGTTTDRTPPSTADATAATQVSSFVPVGAATFTPEEATDFWTPERLKKAKPVEAEAAGAAPSIAAAEGEENTPAADGPEGGVDGTLTSNAAPADAGGAQDQSSGQEPGYPYKRFAWPGDLTSAPAATEGKVFFVDPSDGEEYVCSGTVVNSDNQSVVWTAGHCVYDSKAGNYMTKWVFVPGYDNGRAPFGIWPSVSLATPKGWTQRNVSYDFAAAVVDRVEGKTLQEAVGGSQGLRWNAPVGEGLQVTDLGYPAAEPFDGETLTTCDSTVAGFDDRTSLNLDEAEATGTQPRLVIGCDMTGGSSGGGWIADYQPQRGWGYVTSVNSHSPNGASVMIGPYFDTGAQNVYEYASSR